MRLYSRIYLHFLAVLLTVGLLASTISVSGARSAFLRDIASRVVKHAGVLVGESFNSPATLDRRLQQLTTDFDVDITVRRLDGELVANVGTALPVVSDRMMLDLQRKNLLHKFNRRRLATAIVKDPQSGTALGTMSVAMRGPVGWGLFQRSFLLVLGALSLVALGTRPLARRIAEPLEKLTAAARRYGDGDLAYRVPIAASSVPNRSNDELQHLTGAFNDMAERVEHMVRSQKELLANVSHELRSPLARMRMALSLMPGTDRERWIADFDTDIGELETLINDVLTTAGLAASGLPSRLQPLDVRTLLQDLARRTAQAPGFGGQQARVEVAQDVPAAVEADVALLKRALWNLLDNAAKHGAPPIVLSAAIHGNVLKLAVSDHGRGIPTDQRQRVTEPFIRLAENARDNAEPGGHGIGLTLSGQIAKAHGGSLNVGTLANGSGCTVEISIPLDPPPPPQTQGQDLPL
jgi:two-component system, OmpR family, sensor kinase